MHTQTVAIYMHMFSNSYAFNYLWRDNKSHARTYNWLWLVWPYAQLLVSFWDRQALFKGLATLWGPVLGQQETGNKLLLAKQDYDKNMRRDM